MCTELEWATNERKWEGYMAKKREGIFRKEAGFTSAESTAITNQYSWVMIHHEGFSYGDLRQKMVQYAFKLGGYDFVAMIECENGNWDLHARGDSGEAYWLCQMNRLYHKDIPQAYYDWVWQVQIEYCYQKWKQGTVFYGPQRIIKGKKCYEFIKDRFTYVE